MAAHRALVAVVLGGGPAVFPVVLGGGPAVFPVPPLLGAVFFWNVNHAFARSRWG